MENIFSVSSATMPTVPYKYITTEEAAKSALSELHNYKRIEVDTETTGLDPYTSKPVLVQIGIPGMSYVFDVRHDTDFSSVHISIFKDLLTDESICKLLQNSVFDKKVFKKNAGFYVNNVYDTMLSEQLLNAGLIGIGASLADITQRYLGLTLNKEPRGTFEDYYQKFEPYQLEYAAKDVALLSPIADLQQEKLVKEGLVPVSQLEFDFTNAMCEMELNGMLLDVPKWRTMFEFISEDYTQLQKDLNKMLASNHGQRVMFDLPVINLDSNAQLLKTLRGLGLKIDSTEAKVLAKFKSNPVVAKILEYRKLSKLLSTYGEALIDRINPVTGRLHSWFQQLVSTGRMSSSNPNL